MKISVSQFNDDGFVHDVDYVQKHEGVYEVEGQPGIYVISDGDDLLTVSPNHRYLIWNDEDNENYMFRRSSKTVTFSN